MSQSLRRIVLVSVASVFVAGAALAQSGGDMSGYKRAVAERIASASKAKPTKAAVRDISVVGYTIDSQGKVSETWIVRAAGDKGMNDKALAMFNKALPLPTPPASLFGDEKQVSLSEAFVFTADGQYRLQSLIK